MKIRVYPDKNQVLSYHITHLKTSLESIFKYKFKVNYYTEEYGYIDLNMTSNKTEKQTKVITNERIE